VTFGAEAENGPQDISLQAGRLAEAANAAYRAVAVVDSRPMPGRQVWMNSNRRVRRRRRHGNKNAAKRDDPGFE